MQYYLRKIAPLSLRVSTIILCALKVLQSGHFGASARAHQCRKQAFWKYRGIYRISGFFLETALVKSRHPSSFRLNPMCLSEFQVVKGAIQPFITLHHIINQRHSRVSFYIFLAEISVFSTESYLCVNIENMNKEKKTLKIRQLGFL